MQTAPIGIMSYDKIKGLTDIVTKNPLTIEQIATCLSRICRYGGRGKHFYSVAQHSVIVSLMVPPEHVLQALMHDALESYTGDIVGTFKRELKPFVSVKEQTLEKILFKQHDIPHPIHPIVDEADKRICAAEMDGLEYSSKIRFRKDGRSTWTHFWDMELSAKIFVKRYNQIKGGK